MDFSSYEEYVSRWIHIYVFHFLCRRWDKHRHDQVTALYKALGMSIDSLEYSLKEYYKDFALFMDDLNIRPEVSTHFCGVGREAQFSTLVPRVKRGNS